MINAGVDLMMKTAIRLLGRQTGGNQTLTLTEGAAAAAEPDEAAHAYKSSEVEGNESG